MKKTALRVACITSLVLFATTPVHAVEQKTVFNTESIKYESGTGSERCRDKCDRKSGPDVKSLLSEGWKIVSSSSKEVTGEQYWYVPCNTCLPHGCICNGTEYVLRKDGPTPAIESRNNVADTPVKTVQPAPQTVPQTVPQAFQAEPPKNELDLLKKENDSLKQENALLRQENETLRNQLHSIRK